MDATSLLELLLLSRAAPQRSAGDSSAHPTQERRVANEFEFLDKHYDSTDIAEVAAQAAVERFGYYPNARTSTVIFGIPWDKLTALIAQAVSNYGNGGVYNAQAYATLTSDGLQWQIVVTGLRFVNATRTMSGGRPEYEIDEYSNGTVFLNAEMGDALQLGEIVHLDTGIGTWKKRVEVKNPPSY
ncbi:hypothetical protein J5226_23725 [Lysobacter sp. K5869]|uniref:hypothetical protein n=1 Tax=Lysobacter sp. K5869 TaxID=2820808 RepID=UPI001C061E2E|nr:hypothetical protein [Lysobacter sp. K5869]QWP76552.1 hypothetical protein J5226_23725 [Lysobacter sp. K5869]